MNKSNYKNNNKNNNYDNYRILNYQRLIKQLRFALIIGLLKIILGSFLIIVLFVISTELYNRYLNKLSSENLKYVDILQQSNHNYSRIIGTPTRQEVELKWAIDFDHLDFSLVELTWMLYNYVNQIKQDLNFGKKAGCSIYLDKTPQTFAFMDDYFDTKNFIIHKNNSSYRTRRRWSSYNRFLSHQFIPWSKLFYPTRIEIQSKTGYRKNSQTNQHLITVDEARFEFTKNASPFNEGFALPAINSIMKKDLYRYTIEGQFDNYPIYPFIALQDYLLDNHHRTVTKNASYKYHDHQAINRLNNSVSLLSKRYRFHLNCEHPLGTGPNPHQLFIITIDHVVCASSCCNQKQIVEIEVERERNSSTMIDQLISTEKSLLLQQNIIAKQAFGYIQKLKLAYEQDHQLISNTLFSILKKNSIKILPAQSKYSRFVCTL